MSRDVLTFPEMDATPGARASGRVPLGLRVPNPPPWWAGRTAELTQASAALQSTPALAITGEPGIGKTAFALALHSALVRADDPSVRNALRVSLDARPPGRLVPHLIDVLSRIAGFPTDLRSLAADPALALATLTDVADAGAWWILLDEAEHVDPTELVELLRAVSTYARHSHWIVTLSELPERVAPHMAHVRLGPLTPAERADVAQRLGAHARPAPSELPGSPRELLVALRLGDDQAAERERARAAMSLLRRPIPARVLTSLPGFPDDAALAGLIRLGDALDLPRGVWLRREKGASPQAAPDLAALARSPNIAMKAPGSRRSGCLPRPVSTISSRSCCATVPRASASRVTRPTSGTFSPGFRRLRWLSARPPPPGDAGPPSSWATPTPPATWPTQRTTPPRPTLRSISERGYGSGPAPSPRHTIWRRRPPRSPAIPTSATERDARAHASPIAADVAAYVPAQRAVLATLLGLPPGNDDETTPRRNAWLARTTDAFRSMHRGRWGRTPLIDSTTRGESAEQALQVLLVRAATQLGADQPAGALATYDAARREALRCGQTLYALHAAHGACLAAACCGDGPQLSAEAAHYTAIAAPESLRGIEEAAFFEEAAQRGAPEPQTLLRLAASSTAASTVSRWSRWLLGADVEVDPVEHRMLGVCVARSPRCRGRSVVAWPSQVDFDWANAVVVDPVERCLDSASSVVLLDRNETLWALLAALLHSGRASKEELVLEVWRVREYHPLHHDNRLRVAARKLRALLERLHTNAAIETTDDGYALAGPWLHCPLAATPHP